MQTEGGRGPRMSTVVQSEVQVQPQKRSEPCHLRDTILPKQDPPQAAPAKGLLETALSSGMWQTSTRAAVSNGDKYSVY